MELLAPCLPVLRVVGRRDDLRVVERREVGAVHRARQVFVAWRARISAHVSGRLRQRHRAFGTALGPYVVAQRASIAGRLGIDVLAPAVSTQSEAAAHASSSASRVDRRSASAVASTPVNVSPAAVVSTAVTFGVATRYLAPSPSA